MTHPIFGFIQKGESPDYSHAVYLQLHPLIRLGFWVHNAPGINRPFFAYWRRNGGFNIRVWRLALSRKMQFSQQAAPERSEEGRLSARIRRFGDSIAILGISAFAMFDAYLIILLLRLTLEP